MSKVTITVSGGVGSGKSAVCGEIEILCRALGLKVEWVDGQHEKNLTHADWTEALEMYKPEVVIFEQHSAATVGLTDAQELTLIMLDTLIDDFAAAEKIGTPGQRTGARQALMKEYRSLLEASNAATSAVARRTALDSDVRQPCEITQSQIVALMEACKDFGFRPTATAVIVTMLQKVMGQTR